MVGSGFFDGFGLGFFDKRRIVEPTGKRSGFLFGGFGRFGEARVFGVEVDDASLRGITESSPSNNY